MRLIDADALRDELLGKYAFTEEEDCIAYYIDNAPTIDAVPVRHGEWIKTDDNICYARICSVCRKHVRVCIGLRCHDCDTEANYCPNCGAKMDGERKEKENV